MIRVFLLEVFGEAGLGVYFFDEAGFEVEGDVVHFTGDLVAVGGVWVEADGFGFGADFEGGGGAFEFDVFDHGDDVSVLEEVAVGVEDGCGGVDGGVFGVVLCVVVIPFVAAGEAFVVLVGGEDFVGFAEWAGVHGVCVVGWERGREKSGVWDFSRGFCFFVIGLVGGFFVVFGACADVEDFDDEGEGHGDVDVAFGEVEVEAFGDEGGADEDEEGEGEHFDGGVVGDEA